MAGLLNKYGKKYMLRIISCFPLLIFSTVAFSQHGYNPPSAVQESFHKDYPKSESVEWGKSGKDYTVKFNDRDHDNGESVAYYKSNGGHIETHTQYDNHDVPKPVMDHMNKYYTGSENYSVVHIDRHSGPDLYEVHYTTKSPSIKFMLMIMARSILTMLIISKS